MNFHSINWMAVIVCALVYLIVGGIWFRRGKTAFYRAGLEVTGKPDVLGGGLNPAVLWPLTALTALVQAVFIALMVNALGSLTPGGPTLGSGALTGFILWLGFVAPASLTNKLFAGQLTAWLLTTGNQLVDYVLMGAILGAWR